MNTVDLFKTVSNWGPVLFGLGFIAPLIAQSMQAASLAPPLGLSPIQFGLGVAIPLGFLAKQRGTWI